MKKLTVLLLCLVVAACASTPQKPNGEQDLKAKLERGDRALREARLTDAEIVYRELTQAHPNLPEVWLRLGNVYMREAQIEAAIRVYQDGLRYDQEDGRIWYNLAIARIKQAAQTLESANNALPKDSPFRNAILQLHNRLLSRAVQGPDTQAPLEP